MRAAGAGRSPNYHRPHGRSTRRPARNHRRVERGEPHGSPRRRSSRPTRSWWAPTCTTRRRRTTRRSGPRRRPIWSTGSSRGTPSSTGSSRTPRWFDGGTLNVSYNCLDRHVLAGNGDRVAFHWEGEPGDTRTITYAELLDEVCRFANVLKSLGIAKGDRVNIYLPMIPEAAVAMLACARIGAAAQRGLRRLLRPVARRPHQRRRGQGADHRRRRVPARVGVPAEGGRRRGLRGRRRRSNTSWSCGAAATTSRWSTVATTGTTT